VKIIVERQINHVYQKVVAPMMEKDKTDPKPPEPKEEDTDADKDAVPQEAEPEYVGLPDRDLKKNLGCG